MDQKPSKLRRKLIIYPDIQIPLIAWSGALGLLGALFSASFIVFMANHPDAPFAQTRLLFGIGGLIMFSAYAILLSYYTNRLFGPVYRLHSSLKKLAANQETGPIKLRDGDHFMDLIDDFNRAFELKLKK